MSFHCIVRLVMCGSHFSGKALVIGGDSNPDLTLNGRLVFKDVQFEDGGKYTCNVEHPISGETDSFTFRLRIQGRWS